MSAPAVKKRKKSSKHPVSTRAKMPKTKMSVVSIVPTAIFIVPRSGMKRASMASNRNPMQIDATARAKNMPRYGSECATVTGGWNASTVSVSRRRTPARRHRAWWITSWKLPEP